ncbi:MAG: DegT/DnrJ/EryC1/StrS family aminotransferase [Chloroflexota bacterium]
MVDLVPVNEPFIGEQEAQFVLECLRTGWISSEGRFIREFEERWAAYCGMAHGVAVSNGTVALEIALTCLDLQPGDEVILPTFTIISCAQAVTRNGGRPVLVDSDPHTWCMDVNQVAARITPRTRAIMPVHMYGHPVDMDPLLALAQQYDLTVIEDAAEAHGAEYKGRKCGGMGHLNCFSFYANKIVTTGEGGMVLARDARQAERLRSLRNLCFQKERRFYHTELGGNYRLTNLQAAVGLAQVERIEESVAKKRWMAGEYNQRLGGLPMLHLPVEQPWARNVYWMYGLVLDEAAGMDAAEFARRLAEKGIMTRPFFLGMHEQPAFHAMGLFQGERYPVAERIARQGLYLPSGMTLSQAQIERVCQAIHEVLS